MRGPTRIFWADLTPFSRQYAEELLSTGLASLEARMTSHGL
jgi:hypothetical protein